MTTATKDSPSAPRGRGAKMPKTSTSKRPKDDFGRILRAALVKCDQTLYRVSMETGIGQDVLSRFVREERGLSLETAGRLAVHLGYQLKRV
jgi:plasmid maintenance system antidote protein VapI